MSPVQDDINLVVVCIVGVLAYIGIGGFAWALMPADWDDPPAPGHHPPERGLPIRGFLTICWPCALVGYVVYRIALIGPRTMARRRVRSADRKLARAQVVRS